ncbi:MAG: type IV pilus assembly protein PilM [Planctomycetota bacterium]
MASTAWGIDIGNRALKAIKLTREGGELKVEDFAFVEHETPLSQAGDNRDTLIQQSLGKFVEENETKKLPIAVGVTGGQTFSKFVKLPPVEAKEVDKIVNFEAIQQIPFPLDDVEWSYQLFQEPDDPDLEVGIFAMRKELVNQHVANFTDLELNVQLVQTNPLALYNGVQHDGRLVKGAAMILDMGMDNTDLIIADDHTIWTRNIPIGGNSFTEAIESAFKVDFAKAEKLKREAKSSKYSRQIFQAMRPIFAELVSEIQRSQGFYTSTHKDKKIRKVIPMGGGFKLPMLAKYLQQNLSMPVDRPDRFLANPPSDSAKASAYSDQLLSLGAAYGLALQGLGETSVQANLLPEHIRKEQLWAGKTKWFAAAAALFVVGAMVPLAAFGVNSLAFNNPVAEDNRRDVDQILSKARNLDSQWASNVQDAGGDNLVKIRNARDLAEYQTFWADFYPAPFVALPQPQPEVARGLAEGDADMVKQVPRDQRTIVQIEGFQAKYVSDLASIANDTDFVTAAGSALGERTRGRQFGRGRDAEEAPATEGPVPADARGFVVQLDLISPMAQADVFVSSEVIPALEAIGPNPDNPNARYKVVKAVVADSDQFKRNNQRLDDMERAYTATQEETQLGADLGTRRNNTRGNRGGFGGFEGYGGEFGGFENFGEFGGPPRDFRPRNNQRNRSGRQGNLYDDEDGNAAYLDRLTGESQLDDWEITVYLAVMVDPEPYEPEAAPEGEDPVDGDFNATALNQ